MAFFTISTDSATMTIEAASADKAAEKFAESEGWRGVHDVPSWEAYLERVGGYGHIAKDGVDLARVSA